MSGKRSYDVANRIFGFNGWKSEITQSRVESAEETLDGTFIAIVETTIKVTLKDGTYYEATGLGKSFNARAKHAALGKAKKHALTDAKKRALQKFGILDQMLAVNNETYQNAELKSETLSPPFASLKKKKKSSLFKRSGKLDLQKTTFNTRRDLVFIKHRPISELTLSDPDMKSSLQTSTFTPNAGIEHLLQQQESPLTSHSKSTTPVQHNSNDVPSTSHNKAKTPVQHNSNNVPSTSHNKTSFHIKKEQSIKNNNTTNKTMKAEDPNHHNLLPASDKKDVQLPTIPALSLQDSFSYDGEDEFFAELIKQEQKDDSLLNEMDDGFLGSISTQALVGNR
ncbi:hypothetical protein K501DRAFT_282112, partial [Backusella circina FSU 941]